MLKLKNVTLCCVGSEKYAIQQQKMLDYCLSKAEFGAVKNIIAPTHSIDEWNRYIVYELGDHIDTEFAFLVHPDGGIGNVDAWDDKWLSYDFIGSPFPLPTDNFSYRDINGVLQRVGNSVSIRSKKLMELPKKLNMEWKSFHGFWNEDGFICVNMRHVFEENGCKFAPLEEAVKFGMEYPVPEHDSLEQDPFVYHKMIGDINKKYPDFEKYDS